MRGQNDGHALAVQAAVGQPAGQPADQPADILDDAGLDAPSRCAQPVRPAGAPGTSRCGPATIGPAGVRGASTLPGKRCGTSRHTTTTCPQEKTACNSFATPPWSRWRWPPPPTAAHAQAQATVKNDGQFRAALGLGASLASGNTKANNLSIHADAVRATAQNKPSLYGNLQYARSNGETTADQLRLGTRYDHDLDARLFTFGGLDVERNKFANLNLRAELSAGLGWHVIKTPATTFDLFGGLGYVSDNYRTAMVIDGSSRDSYSYLSLRLGEESTHQLSASTSVKQRLTMVPNLKNRGEFRASWDAGLAVAMRKSWNLNVGLSVAHNSEPGAGRKATDTLMTTSVSLKFD